MIKHGVARRYAEALVEVASKADLLDQIEQELRGIVETVASDPTLAGVLADPKVTPEKKKSILEGLFSGQINTYLLNTLKILVDKKRTDYLKDILDQYVDLANESRGIAVAHVTAAHELDAAACEELKSRLKKLTGKEIKLDIHIDPNIIGGAKVRIGDTVIDASVEGRLSGLEASLSKLRFDVDSVDTD